LGTAVYGAPVTSPDLVDGSTNPSDHRALVADVFDDIPA
jgi:hypothetical protein